MAGSRFPSLILGLVILAALASPAAAFGAGNIASISKVEGQNWRHGDIEDALLSIAMARAFNGKKFSKLMVSRVYFGNWLRDYSQAIDVGTVKAVSAEAIRLLLCVLGFMTFGYGSGEFEVTADRVGCYRPEDHIDNPKDYADNVDARDYYDRLRGPVDERAELSVDERNGMKKYIASESDNIMTSAKHVRNLFTRCIELGRRYKQNSDKADRNEALRLMGTGLHCLEDFFAHSNYTELALIELGERDVFPHCGTNTKIQLEGAQDSVYPIVTGTFGGVDFLHSVTGEVSDKLTQNEIEELEGALEQRKESDTSFLRELLDKIPDGILGGGHEKQKIDEIQENASAAQMQNTSVSPRDPEEFTLYVKNIFDQIMPAIKLHDDIMKTIGNAIDKIPVLPKIIEQLEEQLTQFVFSIMAPFIVPLIRQIRNELKTGSEEIIQSSQNQQHVVFNDDNSTDPTHSMLSKDHFSNILNEIAGRGAAKTVSWAVPQLMEAIDDESVDVNRLCDRLINGVLHHPAQRSMGDDGVSEARQMIFQVVEEWWGQMGDDQRDDYRRKLSRDGVLKGDNHKEGVHDTGHGHGCVGKLEMRKLYGEPETMETKIASAAANAIFSSASGVVSDIVEQQTGIQLPGRQGREESGGLKGFIKSIFSNDEDEGSAGRTENRPDQSSNNSGGRNDGGGRQEHSSGGNGYSGRQDSGRQESDSYGSSSQGRDDDYGGRRHESGNRREDSYGGRNDSSYGGSSGNSGYGGRQEGSHGGRSDSGYSGRQDSSYGGRQDSSYGGRQDSSYGGRQDSSYGGREEGYGGRQESSYGGREESYGGRQDSSYGGREESYGGRQESSYGGRQESNYGGRQESSYGGRHESNYGGREESYGGREESSHGRNSGHGSRRDDDYGGDESSYGGRNEGGYGSNSGRGEYGRQDEYGQGGEYGRREHGGSGRHRRDEDEYDNDRY
ncbi:NIMA-interacting protein TinC [Cordyceps javanica]|uniref:NIMA-interacting protein TinC n=1 Tax=Cordyceps javanica TaxID=43265 RepID=A0A545W0T6_9HYPO|nr:NIMA-interacting protein TinC [Cordyceps javanica]TQW07574.1 NIMA-interacting protein TinC [Cordyceps javanica]